MERWIDRSSLTDDPLNNGDESAGNTIPGQTIPLFCAMVEKVSFLRIAEGFLFYFDKLRPLLFSVLKIFGIEKLHLLKPAVAALEAHLAKNGGPWICGDAYSLADVSMLRAALAVETPAQTV